MLLGAAVRAGREHLDDPDPAARAAAGRARRARGTDRRPARRAHRLDASVGRAAAGSARRRRPTRTCSASSPRRKSSRRRPRRDRPLDVARDHDHAGRQVARVGVDAGVVVGDRVAVVEVMPAAIRRPPTVRKQSRTGPVGPKHLEQAPEEQPARVAAGRRREQAVDAPAPLVEVDERLEVGQRVGRVGQARPRRPPRRGGPCAGSRGAPSCRGSPGSRRGRRRPRETSRPGRRPRARG